MEPLEDIEEEVAKKEVEATPDLDKQLSEEEFSKLNDQQQQEFFEKSFDRKVEEAREPEKEEEEEPEAEIPEEEPEVEVPDEEEADAPEEEPEIDEDAPVTEKRLKDTQKAFRAARSENAELKKRLDEIEKKVSEPAKPATPEKPPELTLKTIRPEVLQRALKENPIETNRWIVDQQVKISLEEQRLSQEANAKEVERINSMKASEEATIKKFPVLKEILDMGEAGLSKLKETSKVKYEFGSKTAKYFKEFSARGDHEAFYNAAARAYVELSPEMIQEVQKETKRLVEQESANKKRILGKVSIPGNRGAVGSKDSMKHKTVSDDEFMNMTPAQQMEYWDKSFDSRRKK